MRINALSACLSLAAMTTFGALPDRPDDLSFPTKTPVTAKGTYTVSGAGHEIVLSGAISGTVTVKADAPCRVTLDNVTLSGQLAIEGEAILWATGASTLSNAGKAVVSASGELMLAGDGQATLTGGGPKKAKAVVYSGDALTVAGGTWNVNMSLSTEAKGFGLAATKKLKMVAGAVNVVSASTAYKDTAVYSDKKDIAISGGILRVTQSGPKSVALNTDAASASVKVSGGAVILDIRGAGAKGVKCDGAFEMSGGLLSAVVSGGPLYEAYEYGEGTNLTVKVSSSTLVTAGTYLVEDVTAAAAVKCGTVRVSGGTVRIVADGVSSRGLVADTTLGISGGVFDIAANGATTEPVIDLVTDDVLTQVELDRKTAACIKQGDALGAATITGGTFYLVATNCGGKCFSVDGSLTFGTSGTVTRPAADSYSPDVQCSTYGNKQYVARQKLAAYTTLGTAVATTDASAAIQLSQNASRVQGNGDSENYDYTNPKCIKAEGNITFESGRLRMFSKCDGGEGLESKANLTINGGVIVGTCYDDVIQATDTITINGGYLFCGSTNNDGIDANDTVVINGGVVLAFTLKTPEVGIDVDNANNLLINGGIVLAVGSASTMAFGSHGSQKSYLSTSASLSTYAGKFLKIAGTSVYVKVPACASGGSCSIMCSAPGCTSSAPTVSTAASGTDSGFFGVHTDGAATLSAANAFGWGGWRPGPGGGGGGQPDQPGGGGGSFTFDAFLTEPTTTDGCTVYGNLMTGYDPDSTAVTLPASVTAIADGALAGNASVTVIDATAASALAALPESFAAGCDALTTVSLPAATRTVGASAFAMDASLKSFTGEGVTALGAYAFHGCSSLALSADAAFETADETSLAGVSLKDGDAVYPSAAAPLVTWLKAETPAGGPSSYNAADLRAWLTSDAANLEAYLYADAFATNANFTVLSVSGTNFLFTAQDLKTLSVARAALQVSTDLATWRTVAESDLADGVYAMPSPTNGFARIVYSLTW